MTLSRELLDILACPKCKGGVNYKEKENRLHCVKCNLSYEVKEDIPVMLVDQATTIVS
ncbi:MAG: Trm112 family protein [Elusimicrobia bacterium]|jgi:uncharacterized protein YbaR (Trm112 family)|nr:Trm112 family protein [Elusimicrobiota bacterium]